MASSPPNDVLGGLPLPQDCIHFVDSPYSDEFRLFLSALDRAEVVGMDAEWKPLRGRKGGLACPRVSIMQLACRLSKNKAEETLGTQEILGELVELGDLSSRDCIPLDNLEGEWDFEQDDGTIGEESLITVDDRSNESLENKEVTPEDLTNSMDVRQPQERLLECNLSKLTDPQELIFLLDMMSLPAWSFWEAMKKMLVSRNVLKLGFRFKQDLINLAGSFSGPSAHSCFDKVDPYVDIGRLYCELRGCGSSGFKTMQNGTTFESLSLTTVCEQVLGFALCKDLQCSNWECRPLTSEQVAYAAADAYCLLVIYDTLEIEASTQFYKACEVSGAPETSPTSTKNGIAELLLTTQMKSLVLSGGLVRGSILHACHGVASTMVRSAVSTGSCGLYTTDAASLSSTAHLISRKFGERLLVNGEGSSKFARRKPKTRRGRVIEKSNQQEVHSWFGPPPWDPSCGGDGSPKFLCDVMVEGLAKQLRNMGIDTACPRVQKSDPRKLVEQAEKEGRVLLTRDIRLLRRRLVPQNLAYRVQSLAKRDQLAEVIKTFSLTISEDNLLSRCTKCNGDFIPEPLTPEEAVAAVTKGQDIPEYAVRERLLFWQCSGCQHMYWQGNQFHRALQDFQALARKIQLEPPV